MGERAKSHELPRRTPAAEQRPRGDPEHANRVLSYMQSDLDDAYRKKGIVDLRMTIWTVFLVPPYSSLHRDPTSLFLIWQMVLGVRGQIEIRCCCLPLIPSPSFFTRLAPLTPVVIYG